MVTNVEYLKECLYFQDNTGTLEVLKAALKDSGDLPFKERLKYLRTKFLTHREMGECESYYRLLPSLHLVGSNIQKIFVPTGLNKSRLLKKLSDEEGKNKKNAMKISEKGQEGYYEETTNILEKYSGRPKELRWMSGMQFAKRYSNYGALRKFETENDQFEEKLEDKVLEIEEESDFEEDTNTIEDDFIIALDPAKRGTFTIPKQIEVEFEGKKYTMRRRKPQVVRLHKWKMEVEPHNYFFAELELYHVFEDSETLEECRESLDKCLEIYNANIESINYVRRKTMPFMKHVEDQMEKAEVIANEDDIADALDSEAAKDNADCAGEEVEETDNFVAHDIENAPKESESKNVNSDRLFKRIEIDDEETLRNKTRSLDDDQLFVVEEVINYCKLYKRARVDNNDVPPPLFRKVVGSAGTGKSFLIDICSQWCEKILRTSGDNIDHPYVLRTAFMGGAAANISGQTLNSAFSLPRGFAISAFSNQKTRDNLMTLLSNLRIGKIMV